MNPPFSPLYSAYCSDLPSIFTGCPDPCNISTSSPASCPSRSSRVPRLSTRHLARMHNSTLVESVSIVRRDSNGRPDTFSSSTPFGQIGPGYRVWDLYELESSVHPVRVKGLASWRRTVVQSARGNPPFPEPNGSEGSGEIKKDRGGGSGRRVLAERETGKAYVWLG